MLCRPEEKRFQCIPRRSEDLLGNVEIVSTVENVILWLVGWGQGSAFPARLREYQGSP